MSVRLFVITCVVTATTIGCGMGPSADYSSVELVDVEGIVKLDGQPVPSAVVMVEDLQTGLQSYGLSDDNGHFRLHFDSVEYGVVPGEKRVIISTTMKVPGLNSDEDGPEFEEGEDGETIADAEVEEQIPDAYRSDSRLRVTVSKSTSHLEFDLSSDGSTTSAI